MGEKCVVAEYILPTPVFAERVQLYVSHIEPQIAQRILEAECFVEPQAAQNLVVDTTDQTHPVTSSPSVLEIEIQRIPDQRINISDSQPVITRVGDVRNPTREELYAFIYRNFSEVEALQVLNTVLTMQPNQTINLSELAITISGNLPTENPSQEICNLVSHHLNMEVEDPGILETGESFDYDNLVVIAEQHNTRIQLNLCVFIGILSISIFLLIFGLNNRSFIK
jgi:hypothetical protein